MGGSCKRVRIEQMKLDGKWEMGNGKNYVPIREGLNNFDWRQVRYDTKSVLYLLVQVR